MSGKTKRQDQVVLIALAQPIQFMLHDVERKARKIEPLVKGRKKRMDNLY